MRVLDCGRKKRAFHAVAISPDGALVAAAGEYGPTCVWDVATGELRHQFEPVGYPHRDIHFHPLTGRLLIPTRLGLVIGDPHTGAPLRGFGSAYFGMLAVDSSADWCVCCNQHEGFVVLSAVARIGAADEELLWRRGFTDTATDHGSAQHLALLADGERFLSAEYVTGPNYSHRRYRVALRARDDGRLLDESGPVFGWGDRVVASPHSGAFVVVSNSGLRVHAIDELDTALPLVVRNDNRKHFTGAAFHPSGKYLMAASNDTTVKLFDTATWDVVRSFTWDIGRMRCIAFSADGALAVAGSDKGKVMVWDVDV